MPWHKLGMLYAPRPLHPKLLTHAANPVPIRQAGGSVYRVLFSGRDEKNRSSVGWVDVDLETMRLIGTCSEPLFTHGPAGSFYSEGISIGNVYETGGARYLPFMGWQVPQGAHWRGDIGRFRVTRDDGLQLDPDGVWLGHSDVDPLSLSYPWVMRTPDGGYRMWYGSTHTWDAGNGEMVHALHGATSMDGHAWTLTGPAVPFEVGKAQAFSRPTVATLPSGEHRMWFSYRSGTGQAYRIGTARSTDLSAWALATADIDVSPSGWDAEMIEYPHVFWHDGRLLMLYNGNGFGASGFGLAEWS